MYTYTYIYIHSSIYARMYSLPKRERFAVCLTLEGVPLQDKEAGMYEKKAAKTVTRLAVASFRMHVERCFSFFFFVATPPYFLKKLMKRTNSVGRKSKRRAEGNQLSCLKVILRLRCRDGRLPQLPPPSFPSFCRPPQKKN